MTIRIPWESNHAGVGGAMSAPSDDWPAPRIDEPWISERERRRARRAWTRRCRASYATAGRAAGLLRGALQLGAPVDVLSGLGYTCDELVQHLATVFHLLSGFDSPSIPPLADRTLGDREQSPSSTLGAAIDLFGFNLSVSAAVYRAISAVTTDPAIGDLTGALVRSLDELTAFGKRVVEWISSAIPAQDRNQILDRLPQYYAAYERLCAAGTDVLDRIAGLELTLEPRSDNLGTIDDEELAVIFYDTLESSIFSVISPLDADPAPRWHRRITASPLPIPPAVAAVGCGRTPGVQ